MWVDARDIRDSTGISRVTLSKMGSRGHDWVRKNGATLQFDVDSLGFQDWVSSAMEASQRRKAELRSLSEISSGIENKQNEKEYLDNDDDQLITKAKNAKYQSMINAAELSRFKIEMQKIELEKIAGNLIERQFAEFAFFGYLERLNQEILLLPKKFTAKIEHLLTDHIVNNPDIQKIESSEIREVVIDIISTLDRKSIASELVKMNICEYEEIIRTVKKSQLEDIENWNKERDK